MKGIHQPFAANGRPVIDAELAALMPAYKAALNEMGISTDGYTPEEVCTFMDILEEYEETGSSGIEGRLVEADYGRPPPTIEEFCENEFWLGSVLQRDDKVAQQGMFPKWRDELYKVFSPGRQINQVILTGSIGIGKSFVGAVIMLFRLAHLLCLRNPVQYYGLSRISRIIFSCFSVTKDQVMGGVFQDMIGMMGNSPFFNEVMPVGDRKFSSQKIDFPNNVLLKAGSRLHQALGGNVLMTLIDEINFRLEKDAAKAAKDLVNSLERRQESRFKQHQDTMMVLISSAKHQVDFLTQHIAKNRDNPKVVIWDFPLWDIRGGVTIHYSGKRFAVDIGDNVNPASILPVPDYRDKLASGAEMTALEKQSITAVESLPSSRVIWVPEEHRKIFEDDIESAIRDVAGKVTGRMAKFFPDIMPIINSIKDGLTNPFSVETVKLSVDSTHDVKDLLADRGRVLLMANGGSWIPRRHSYAPRYIHIDIATGGVDALGFTMIHPVYLQSISRTSLITQEESVGMSPVYELDFSFRVIRERPHKEIDFSKLRSFIMWLKNHGFNIRIIGCDLRNLSTEMRGILAKAGFNTVYLSVDTKRDPYDTLKQIVVEGRFQTYRHDYLMMEAVNLQDNVVKIDHPDAFDVQWRKGIIQPKRGSKDLTDSLAGALYLGETDKEHANLPMFSVESMQQVKPAALEKDGIKVPEFSIPTF